MPITHRLFANRTLVALGAAVGLSATLLATSAHADPPTNDNPSRAATEVTTLPALFEADTREATNDPVDRSCVYRRSVWYRYSPTESSRVRITTIGSNYDTVLAVYRGDRSPRTRLSCNDDAAGLQSAVRPRLIAGEQYWIAASTCCGSRASRGGDLTLRLSRGAVPPAVITDVVGATAGGVSGRLRVSGTVTCAVPSVAQIYLAASQRVDGAVARGSSYRFIAVCSSEPTDWSARVDSETAWAFRAGMAALDVESDAYDGFTGASSVLETNVDVTDFALGRAAR